MFNYPSNGRGKKGTPRTYQVYKAGTFARNLALFWPKWNAEVTERERLKDPIYDGKLVILLHDTSVISVNAPNNSWGRVSIEPGNQRMIDAIPKQIIGHIYNQIYLPYFIRDSMDITVWQSGRFVTRSRGVVLIEAVFTLRLDELEPLGEEHIEQNVLFQDKGVIREKIIQDEHAAEQHIVSKLQNMRLPGSPRP